MEDKVAEVTVRVVFPETLPKVAVIVVVPTETPVARPLLFTVAADVLDELQTTWVVMLWLVPSEYVPEAANCSVIPAGMLGLAGVTDMEDRSAGGTVRVVFPEILCEVAEMVVLPDATAVASPLPLTVATDVLDEFQVTRVAITWVVPSEYVPEAVNCSVFPTGTLGFAGVMDIEDRVARFTLKVVFPEMFPEVAAMVVVPDATVVAKPLPSTVATDELEEVQATRVVISLVVPSEYVPEAVNCPVISEGMLELAGVTDMERRLAVDPSDAVLDAPESEPCPPPHPTEIRKGTPRRRQNKCFVFIRHPP
jgi:hypothetical protein